MRRREFLRLLALAATAGASLRPGRSDAQAADELYGVPRFGNVPLLHYTDCHAQLLPVVIWTWKEPPLAGALMPPVPSTVAEYYGS